MHLLSMNIRRALENSVFNDSQRETLVSFALAQSLAFTLPLPSSPVNSASAYYNQNYATEVSRLVSDFNEHFVVRTQEVLEITSKVYQYRYALVYEPTSDASLSVLTVLLSKSNEYLPKVLTDIQEANLKASGFTTLNWIMRDFKKEWVSRQSAPISDTGVVAGG